MCEGEVTRTGSVYAAQIVADGSENGSRFDRCDWKTGSCGWLLCGTKLPFFNSQFKGSKSDHDQAGYGPLLIDQCSGMHLFAVANEPKPFVRTDRVP